MSKTKPAAVVIRHEGTGRVMRASRDAFDREWSKQGWIIHEDPAPTPARTTKTSTGRKAKAETVAGDGGKGGDA